MDSTAHPTSLFLNYVTQGKYLFPGGEVVWSNNIPNSLGGKCDVAMLYFDVRYTAHVFHE